MKICVLSGAPPQASDAVGDFAWQLALELAKEHRISFITSGQGTTLTPSPDERIPIFTVPNGWGRRTLEATKQRIAQEKPDVILTHFVPLLYGWSGTKPFFSQLLLQLKNDGYRIVTVAHEFRAPFGPSPKLMLLSTAQRFLFRRVVQASRKIILTTAYCQMQLRSEFPQRYDDLVQIPVGNVTPVVALTASQRGDRRKQLGLADAELVVATFGSEIDPVVLNLKTVCFSLMRQVDPIRFLVIGKAGETFRKKLSAHPHLTQKMIVTGVLNATAVSESLQLSDLYLTLYADGASCRRSSLMVGLAHGLPTISNWGLLTDSALAASEALILIEKQEDPEVQATLRRLCGNEEWRRGLGMRGQEFFQNHFSWKILGQQYAQVLQEACAR